MATRRTTKPRTLGIGSISEGTLIPEELALETLYVLRRLRLSREDRTRVEALSKELDALEDADGTVAHYSEDGADIWADVSDIADGYVPDYCYFGSHPGDGANVGVCPIEELFQDRRPGGYDGCIAQGRDNAKLEDTHALEENDHGNATLWRRVGKGNRWAEVWSIV